VLIYLHDNIDLLQKVFYGLPMARTDSTPRSNPTSSRSTGDRRRRRDHRALLTAADERWLAQAIEAGREAQRRIDEGAPLGGDVDVVAEGERARHHFIEANVRLVQSIANRFSVPVHLDRDDIAQDGMIGLEKAVEKFDWRRGYKFSTYATWWIRQSIQRGLESSATTIRIPGHRTRELRTAIAAATATGGRLDDDLAMIDMLTQLESMDRPIGEGSDTLGTLVASSDEGPDEAAERRVAREQVDALLEHLDDTSAYAVAARFGLRGHEPATFATIAEELGVTPQAVRRRVERAIAKLRSHTEPIAA
jgi:RNA polymerase primary sigma factor